ncbi:hypothetical protein EJB05_41311, partial [Eragrostis curvula]
LPPYRIPPYIRPRGHGTAASYHERNGHAARLMDAIFSLAPQPRARVLERAAARIPGCLYICLWAPVIPGPLIRSGHLFCLDAWIGGGGRALAAFEAYRGAFCAVVSGCVPGWAYKDGRAYMELPEPDLTASASLQTQQQFYHVSKRHEAGTKMAVFMGCDNGEMEIGFSSDTSPAAVADHVQQSLLEELMQMTPTHPPSSSSSSLPSLSIGSPEYSSLIRSMTTTAAAAEPSSHERPLQPAVQLPGLLPPLYSDAPFPSSDAEDAAMAEAMLAVIASAAPPAPAATVPAPPPPRQLAPTVAGTPPRAALVAAARRDGGVQGVQRGALAEGTAAARRAAAEDGQDGHRAHGERAHGGNARPGARRGAAAGGRLRRRASASAAAAAAHQQPAPPHDLRAAPARAAQRELRDSQSAAPSRIKVFTIILQKDKATVLAHTTEYMNKLIAEVAGLEEKNRQLEAQLIGVPGRTRQAGSDDDSSETTVQVDVTTGASTSTSTSGQPQEVGIKVTVRAECDLSELVMALLARIKEMGRFAVVTVDAEQRDAAHAHVSITLRVVASDEELDEMSLKEAVAKVVEDAVTRRPSPPLL